LPLAVLVNAGSASASEIVAACLQDNGRARVFGERSYGKGTVQQLIAIESGRSLLKLTTARYVRPNGMNIHRTADAKEDDPWGVSPDVGDEVPLTSDEYRDFTMYRSLRDLWGEPPPAELLAAEEAKLNGDGKPSPANDRGDFVDRPLAAAVEYLQRSLDRNRDESNSA
jgi:carboxyl-terminal processing protease